MPAQQPRPSPFLPALAVGVVAIVLAGILALRPDPPPSPVVTPDGQIPAPEPARPRTPDRNASGAARSDSGKTAITPAERAAGPLIDQYWSYYLAGAKTAYARVHALPAIRDGKP